MRFWSINGGRIAFSFQFPQTEFKDTGLPLPQPQQKITVWHYLTLQNFAHDPFLTPDEYERDGIESNPPRGRDLNVKVTGQVAIRKQGEKLGNLPMGEIKESTLEKMLEATRDGTKVRFEIDWNKQGNLTEDDQEGFIKTVFTK